VGISASYWELIGSLIIVVISAAPVVKVVVDESCCKFRSEGVDVVLRYST
jgi:hypothetical protein